VLYIICRRRKQPSTMDTDRLCASVKWNPFVWFLIFDRGLITLWVYISRVFGQGCGEWLVEISPCCLRSNMAFSVTWFGWRKIIILFRYNTPDKSVDFVRILNFSLNWKYYHDKTNLFYWTIKWINLTTVKTTLSLNYIEDLDKKNSSSLKNI